MRIASNGARNEGRGTVAKIADIACREMIISKRRGILARNQKSVLCIGALNFLSAVYYILLWRRAF